MSDLIRADQGYHDIDTEITADTLDHLPHGLMEHHAFQPHLWRAGDVVAITTADGGHYEGHAVEVSNHTGNVLIQLENMPTKHGQANMPSDRIVA